MQIWPAIDICGGKCVRLRQGDFERETVFGDDPLAMAKRWVAAGATRLHLVDLDGARDGQGTNHELIQQIATQAGVPCQLGGGIRDEGTIQKLLDSGLTQLVIGTRALKEPEWFRSVCQQYPARLAIGIDARDGLVATDGWLETSQMDAVELAQTMKDLPIAAIIYTDIARDGMMQGPNLAAMADMNQATATPVIASGGVTTLEDVQRLAELELSGCIIGRALYEGTLNLSDAIAASGTE